MQKMATIFYSILGTLFVLEFLLTSMSIANREPFFTNDIESWDLVIRAIILGICSLCLVQVYLLHAKGRKLSSITYWLILGVNSAIPVYLKYIQDFASGDYSKINQTLFYLSFLTWAMLLVLGVLFNSLYQSRQRQRIMD